MTNKKMNSQINQDPEVQWHFKLLDQTLASNTEIKDTKDMAYNIIATCIAEFAVTRKQLFFHNADSSMILRIL